MADTFRPLEHELTSKMTACSLAQGREERIPSDGFHRPMKETSSITQFSRASIAFGGGVICHEPRIGLPGRLTSMRARVTFANPIAFLSALRMSMLSSSVPVSHTFTLGHACPLSGREQECKCCCNVRCFINLTSRKFSSCAA